MSNTILIGCRLPCGITLDGSRGQGVTLNGANTSMIDSGVGLTHVDATEWMYLELTYASHSAFSSGCVFHFKDSDKVADVVAMAEELKDEKTGFEALDPNAPAPGLKPEDPAKLKEMVRENQGNGPKLPAKKAVSKKDQAAAIEAAMGQ